MRIVLGYLRKRECRVGRLRGHTKASVVPLGGNALAIRLEGVRGHAWNQIIQSATDGFFDNVPNPGHVSNQNLYISLLYSIAILYLYVVY
jgi:hypothetical protein